MTTSMHLYLTGVWVLRSGQLPDECDVGWQDFARAVYRRALEEQLGFD